jgi:ubiquitin-protein ligase
MSVKVSLEQVVQQLTEALADAEKADSGNKAAGTRVRKAAQGAANALKELRKQVLEVRNKDD